MASNAHIHNSKTSPETRKGEKTQRERQTERRTLIGDQAVEELNRLFTSQYHQAVSYAWKCGAGNDERARTAVGEAWESLRNTLQAGKEIHWPGYLYYKVDKHVKDFFTKQKKKRSCIDLTDSDWGRESALEDHEDLGRISRVLGAGATITDPHLKAELNEILDHIEEAIDALPDLDAGLVRFYLEAGGLKDYPDGGNSGANRTRLSRALGKVRARVEQELGEAPLEVSA